MIGRDSTVIVEHKIAQPDAQTDLREPGKYRVVLMNDDYTPMDFVVDVLMRFFYMTEVIATQVMLEVHLKGKGVCGVFTWEIAETKVAMVNEYARAHEYPLLCSMEPV